jgi:hypothetical protein
MTGLYSDEPLHETELRRYGKRWKGYEFFEALVALRMFCRGGEMAMRPRARTAQERHIRKIRAESVIERKTAEFKVG